MRITSGRVALVTSSLALAVAVGGTGYAAAKIGTNDIKNDAITSTKIKNGAVNGNDVKESTLDKVPSAKNADSATFAGDADTVDGAHVVLVEHRSGEVSEVPIGSLNGLTVRVSCTAGGSETLTATTVVDNAEISVNSFDASDDNGGIQNSISDDFDSGQVFTLVNAAAATDRQYTLTYATPDGPSVTAVLTTEDGAANLCWVSGYLIG